MRISLHVILLCWLLVRSEAATIPSASGTLSDVSIAVAGATTGDTVTIPASTNLWQGELLLNKDISLIGAGTNSSSRTLIIWGRHTGANETIMKITAATRVSNISFTSTNNATPDWGIVSAYPTTYKAWRIDHCHFYATRHRAILVYAYECGLIDNCLFSETSPMIGQCQGITVYGFPGTWTRPTSWGTVSNVCVENCVWDWPEQGDNGIETYKSGRLIARFNYFRQTGIGMHGLDSEYIGNRGTYSSEIYGNTFVIPDATAIDYTLENRGGSQVIFSNNVTAVAAYNRYPFSQNVYRSNRDYYYLNPESPDQLLRQSGDKYFKVQGLPGKTNNTGTHTGSNASLVLEDATKTWTVDEWYYGGSAGRRRVWNVTDNSVGTLGHNTATVLTNGTLAYGTDNKWDTGDYYMIISGGAPADGSTYFDLNFPVFDPALHGASTSAGAALVNSAAAWTNSTLIGYKVWNLSDNSKGPVTANTATTATATLSGGLSNVWAIGDEYLFTVGSGSHSAGNGLTNLEDSVQAWTANAFADMYLWNRTTAAHGRVVSNTSTSIVCVMGAGTRRTWNTGDEYVVTQGIPNCDGNGRAGVTRWFGPGETVVAAWNTTNVTHCYIPWQPCYEWQNWVNGTTNIQFTANANNLDTGATPNETNFVYSGFSWFNDTVKPNYTPLVYPHPTTGNSPPDVTFTATPSTITLGNSSLLAWSTVNATSGVGLDGSPVATSGSTNVSPTVTTIYTLSATNVNGVTTSQVTVTIGTPGVSGLFGTRLRRFF